MADDLKERLTARSTGELEDILREHDTEAWRAEVFLLVEAILLERGVDIAAVKAAGPLPEESLEFAPVEAVASFTGALDASLCRMALVESGIEAWCSTEHLVGIAPHLGIAIGVDILVRRENASAAREVLAELQSGAAALPEEPEPCPRCSSAYTEHHRDPDRLTAISGWALAALPVPAGIWRWKCKGCGHEWE